MAQLLDRALDRLPEIATGYFAAAAAAGLLAGLVNAISAALRFPDIPIGHLVILGLGLGFLIAVTGAIFALIPATIAIVIAEKRSLRALTWCLIGGALAGLAAYAIFAAGLIATGGIPGSYREFAAAVVLYFGPPGMAGGVVYWLIAGKNAGVPGILTRDEC